MTPRLRRADQGVEGRRITGSGSVAAAGTHGSPGHYLT
jgi:hypothetical protein